MQVAESLTSNCGNPRRAAARVDITSDIAVDISADDPDCEKLLGHTKLPTESPTNLNALGLECARAARNLSEHFSDARGCAWEKHRKIVVSELSLSVSVFLKTVMFEMVPSTIGCMLCILLEGTVSAHNRGKHPFKGTTLRNFPGQFAFFLLLELLQPQFWSWFLIVFTAIFRAELPASAPFEVFGMIFLIMMARAFILGLKYGLKSDVLTAKGSAVSVHGEEYLKTRQGERGQMVCYILNCNPTDDLQREELIALLYKSSLIADTDLSCASFTWTPMTSVTSRDVGSWTPPLSARQPVSLDGVFGDSLRSKAGGGCPNVALLLWEQMLEVTRAVEAPSVLAETDADGNGSVSLPELHARAREFLGAEYDAAAVAAEFARLDANADGALDVKELGRRGGADVTGKPRLLFGAQHGVLAMLLREHEQVLRARAVHGELPASALAVLIVLETSAVTPAAGRRYAFFSIVLPGLLIALLPVIVRGAFGLGPFGDSVYPCACVHLTLYPSVGWSICVSVCVESMDGVMDGWSLGCMSVSLSILLSVFLFLSLSVSFCLSLSVSLSVSLSLPPHPLSLTTLMTQMPERVRAIMSIVPMCFGSMQLMIYFICPLLYLYRQLLMCRRLLALISPPSGLTVHV